MFDLVTMDDERGRHAFDEDAAFTPIFHALTRGGWRSRHAADPIEEFRSDPLSAPIPTQTPAPTTAPRRHRRAAGAHAIPEPADPAPRGRHHTRW